MTLFSLAVAVDAVALAPPGGGASSSTSSSSSSSSSLLLAFQWLDLDIVLFEGATLVERHSVTCLETDAPIGQSCLFERDAQDLAGAIRADETAALVLLVLEQEAQRARLVAFACVSVALPHVAFASDGTTPRVSEWANIEETWPLVDHAHATRGSIRGSVTLACLGMALTPHVASPEFGLNMKVLTSPQHHETEPQSPVASEAYSRGRQSTQEQEASVIPPSPSEKAKASPPKATQSVSPVKPLDLPPKQEERRDAAVQCEADADGDEGWHPKPILLHGCGSSSHRTTKPTIVDELDRFQSHATRPDNRRRDPPRDPRHAAAPDSVPIEAELPPPLFFHRPQRHPTA